MGIDFTAYAQSSIPADYIEVRVRGRNSQAAARWLAANKQELVDAMVEELLKTTSKLVTAEYLRSLLSVGDAVVNQRVILMLSKRRCILDGDFVFVACIGNKSAVFSLDGEDKTVVKVVHSVEQRWGPYKYYLQTARIGTDKERAEAMYQVLADGVASRGVRGMRKESLAETLQTIKNEWFEKEAEYSDLCTVMIEPGRRVRGDVKEFERMLSEWEEDAADDSFDLTLKCRVPLPSLFNVDALFSAAMEEEFLWPVGTGPFSGC